MRRTHQIVALAVLLGCAGIALAAEQTVLGRSFIVKQRPGDAATRKISGSGKEKGSGPSLVGDPSLFGSAGGAILDVIANGVNPTSQAFVLPQGTGPTGRPFWTKIGTVGFKYKDPTGAQGAVKTVTIKRAPSGKFSIKARISGKNGPVAVVPPNPGTSGCLALKLGRAPLAGDRYSVQFGPESSIKNVGDRLFRAKKPTVEGVCPVVAPTTTSTTVVTVTTSTSTSLTLPSLPSTTTTSSTTTTTLYGSPSRAFRGARFGLLD